MKWGWLKTAGKFAAKAGLEIAEKRVPFFGVITDMVMEGVEAAEANKELTGPQKKEAVLDLIAGRGQEILVALLGEGRVVADDERFKQGAGALIEAVNSIMKSTAPAAALPQADGWVDIPAKLSFKPRVDGSAEYRIVIPPKAPTPIASVPEE